MTSQRSGKSHALAWTLSIIAIPVLYVLSVPPLICLVGKYDMAIIRSEPRWYSAYMAPFDMIYENRFLHGPLKAYLTWWFHLTGMDR